MLNFTTPFGITMSIIVIIFGTLFALSATGCMSSKAAGPYAPLKQTLVATDGGVVTTNSLLSGAVINKTDAQPVLITAKTLLASETAWKTALDAGDATTASITASSVQAGMNTLLDQLKTLQVTKNLKVSPMTGSSRLTGSNAPFRQGVGAGPKKVGEVTAVITIIQLIADLTPKIVDWINGISSQTVVTSGDVQTLIDTLSRDIALLDTAVNG